ncbi:hypothetical protein BCR43DRAFT_433170 [Syncephalastrum racemosum]|uniref:Uncharacterized protein n=1 Tax=Syncephalastrum racemosum TaxID=13706 RepID=A0A1X2HMB5_SYNRA|nr:hypothetical protein BCR43DRAFT_433170 [Syncephalastrum racemosum]
MSLEELRAQGWCISQEGLDTIQESLEKENPTVDDIIGAALDANLRQIGDGRGFRQDGDPTTKTIPAPLVLQVLEIRNVALPSSHQVEKPRLLRIAFSDGGKKKIIGAEILGPVDQIK